MSLPDPPLLLITDRAQAQRPIVDIVTAALVAGCRWVSVREKDLAAPRQIELVKRLLPIVRGFNAFLTLHGDPGIARVSGADGVHLPAHGDQARARAELGEQRLVGISIHSSNDASAVDPAFVDYTIVGPAYASASKPGYSPTLGTAGLQALAGAAVVPVIAIGGIEPAVVAEVMACGASGIAVMGGVMRADDPGATVAALLRALAPARNQPRAR